MRADSVHGSIGKALKSEEIVPDFDNLSIYATVPQSRSNQWCYSQTTWTSSSMDIDVDQTKR